MKIVKPDGVFYFVAVFKSKKRSVLESKNKDIRLYLDSIEHPKLRTDKLFAYELIGSEGICVVPLSGFNCPLDGFRITLLEEDEATFRDTCERIRDAAERFFA